MFELKRTFLEWCTDNAWPILITFKSVSLLSAASILGVAAAGVYGKTIDPLSLGWCVASGVLGLGFALSPNPPKR